MALSIRAVFFTLIFYLIITGVRQKSWVNIKKTVFRQMQKLNALKLLHHIDALIKSSAIDKIIPFFNTYLYLLITVLLFGGSSVLSYLLINSLIPSLGVGVLSGVVPVLVLELLRIINIRRVRRNYHGFLCSLIGFFALSGDIVGSYKNAANYTGEPLKSYVRDAVFKYDRSNKNFDVCLDELAERANEREFIKLIKFTKLYLSYGGDFSNILNKLNNQSQRLENARLSLYSSSYIGIIAISIMTLINIAGIFTVFTRDEAAARVLGTTLVGNGLLLLSLAAMLFAVYTSFRLFRGDI